jgi:hypothetical protein
VTYLIVGDTYDADCILLYSASSIKQAQQVGMALHREGDYSHIRILHARRGKLALAGRIVMQDVAMPDAAEWLAVEQQRLEVEYHQEVDAFKQRSATGFWYGRTPAWPEASLPKEAIWSLEDR